MYRIEKKGVSNFVWAFIIMLVIIVGAMVFFADTLTQEIVVSDEIAINNKMINTIELIRIYMQQKIETMIEEDVDVEDELNDDPPRYNVGYFAKHDATPEIEVTNVDTSGDKVTVEYTVKIEYRSRIFEKKETIEIET